MRAVLLVARARLARSGLGLIAVSVLLGIGFGVSLVSAVAARRTASAYTRILTASDAPDAAVQHGLAPDAAELSLRTIDGIDDQRVYVGFLGHASGIDTAHTRALLAPTADRFPLELPVVRAGRLPDPDVAVRRPEPTTRFMLLRVTLMIPRASKVNPLSMARSSQSSALRTPAVPR